MKRISPWLTLAVVLLAVAGLLAWHLYTDFHEIEKREHDRLVHQVNVIERNLTRQLQITSNVLERIRDELPALQQRPGALDRHFQTLIAAAPGIRTFLIVNREGVAIASNRPELLGNDFRNQDRYKTIRAANDLTLLHISAPFRTPLGLWAISLGRSMRDEQGNFAGYVLAIIEPEYFLELLSAANYEPDMRSGLTHGQGKIILRVPDPEGISGKDLSEAKGSAFYQHMQGGEVVSVFSVDSSASGQRRMVASRTIWPAAVKADQPLVAFAGRETAAIFAEWQANLQRSVIVFALFALAALLGLFAYLRRQAALERVQAAHLADEVLLRRADERMRLATDGAEIGVWYWDQVTGKLDWSATCKHHFGLPEDQEGSFEQFYKVLHPDDSERVTALLQGSPQNSEKIVR